MQAASQVDKHGDIAPYFSGNERYGHKVEAWENLADVISQFGGGDFVADKVPFVDDENRRGGVVEDVFGKLFVYLGDAQSRFEEEHDDICSADRALGAGQTVKLDISLDATAFADAGGINGQNGIAIFLEANIDTVARGTSHLADNDPFLACQAVDKGAFTCVSSADNGQL